MACTVDGCDELTGECTNSPSDAACDDGSYCSGTEQCDAQSGCQSGDAVDCSAIDDQCGLGVCDDAEFGCEIDPINEGQTCDDGLMCTYDDQCTDGECLGLPTCDPVCEACDPNTGECTPMCASPMSKGQGVAASDALEILRAAVGIAECALCVCDLNMSLTVSTTDAALALRRAIGLEVWLECPEYATAEEAAEAENNSTSTSTTLMTTSTTLIFP